MTEKKFEPTGRIWTNRQTARYIGKSPGWLNKHKRRLEKIGFPKVDKKLGGRDSKAVIRFLDQRSGIDQVYQSQSNLLQERAKAIANEKSK